MGLFPMGLYTCGAAPRISRKGVRNLSWPWFARANKELLGPPQKSKAAAEKAVRETCETHVLRTASLRHLAGALGAKSTSLEVYHYLSLRATALQVGRLADALRRCVSLRDRLENEPLLADGVRAAIADAGVELLQAQVQSALDAEEAALQRAEDEAYGRVQMAPAPASYASAPAPAPRMARAYSSASELG